MPLSEVLDFFERTKSQSGATSLWPVNATVMAAFVRYHGIDCAYKAESLENVVIPSLRRIHKDETGSDFSGKFTIYAWSFLVVHCIGSFR